MIKHAKKGKIASTSPSCWRPTCRSRLRRPEVESLLANGSGQKFIFRDYHTTGADLHYSLKTLCRRNFYVAFGIFVGI